MGKKFEVGTTYVTRSACDHECIFRFEVIARTAKRMTIREHGKDSVRGIKVDSDGVEFCYPDGTYSMAPRIIATRKEVSA